MTVQSRASSEITVTTGVAIAMRDGTTLLADVYRPRDGRRGPVLVRRTPYGRGLWAAPARALAEHGYAVAVQDVRGRNGSGGEFAFASRDATTDLPDAADTIAWAADAEFGDGQVGMWGHSYDAWMGWQAATAGDPRLGGVVAASFGMRSLDVTRGILDIGRRLHWYYQVAADARARAKRDDGPTSITEADRVWLDLEKWKWLWSVPLDRIPEYVFAGLTDDLRLHMRTIGEEQWATDTLHPHVSAPVFVITGWWDRMVTSVDNYTGLVANGPAALRGAHRLLVGPWGHQPASYETRRRGSFDFGASSTRSLVAIMARWFDHTLRGIDNGVADEPPVEVFVIGEDRWRFEHEWPPARARQVELFLHSAGSAKGARGDGRLEWRAPADEPVDAYRYDPRDPVMSLMEPNSHWAPYDQSPNDHRRDKLVYRSDALSAPVELAGPVELVLWAASDAPDTDWVARLVDERPDGSAIPVSQGILRARYRHGYASPTLLRDADPREYRVAMTPTCVVFKPGHRIRLDVTSSDFPNYDRNHNTGADYWSDPGFRIASQTIFHDRARPSRLIVPLVGER